MKKAQWKQDPRERTYGVDPRELRVKELEAEQHWSKESIEMLRAKNDYYKAELQNRNEKINLLIRYHTAYKYLRVVGVVMEHEGEFKHLKGADMDEFFGFDKPTATMNPLRGTTATGALVDGLNNAFNEAYSTHINQAMLTGKGITKW